MKRLAIFLGLWFLIASTPTLAAQMRIELQDGEVYVGEVVSLNSGTYHIRTAHGEFDLQAGEVKSMTASGAVAPSPLPAVPVPALSPAAEDLADLNIQGSNTIGAKLLPALLEGYFKSHPELYSGDPEWVQGKTEEDRTLTAKATGTSPPVRVKLQSHGSATAFVGLLAAPGPDRADIGAASRSINEEELKSTAAAGLGDLKSPVGEHVLALDGLVVIVNSKNTVKSLDLDTVARLFSGEITDWSAVGGSAGPVHIYARDDKSGTYDTFKELVLKAPKERKLSPSAKRFESNEDLSQAVDADPDGIGFTGFAYIGNTNPLTLKTACGQEYSATIYSVKTEEYPLARRLFLYTAAQPPRTLAKAFLAFAQSGDAQRIVQENGFINLDIDPSAASYADARIAELSLASDSAGHEVLVRDLQRRIKGARRLSVTFRFRSNSRELDSRAVQDVERLSAYLRQPNLRGHSVTLIGFADARGDFNRNVALSVERAQSISTALQHGGAPAGAIAGFGPLAPVACSTDDVGLAKNRRVEVWVQ